MTLGFDLSLIFWGVLTLCIGSAISALTYRWQKKAEYEWRMEAHEFLELPYYEPAPQSYSQGRSACPSCHHRLSVVDLIPLVSFLFQKGKCRYCQQRISWRYPSIELLTLITLLPLAWLPLPFSEMLVYGVLISALLCAFVIDAENFWLPDECSFIVICCATVLMHMQNETNALAHISAGIFAYLFIYLLRYLFLRLRNIEAIGLGDAKLLAALVFWLGMSSFTNILLLSSLIGLAVALLLRKSKGSKIPFGPYLISAALLHFYLGVF